MLARGIDRKPLELRLFVDHDEVDVVL